MSRFEDTEIAVMDRLRAMKVEPDTTVNLLDLEDPLHAAGFSQDEIAGVLSALEQDRLLELSPGNRLRLLKTLPE